MKPAVRLQELDEDAAKAEEQEALRLQREAAEQLRPEDFELSQASSTEEELEEEDVLGASAGQVRLGQYPVRQGLKQLCQEYREGNGALRSPEKADELGAAAGQVGLVLSFLVLTTAASLCLNAASASTGLLCEQSPAAPVASWRLADQPAAAQLLGQSL